MTKEHTGRGGQPLSRRQMLQAGAIAGFVLAGGNWPAPGRAQVRQRRPNRDLLLVNGRIYTMDDRKSVVSSVRIHNGRFVDVGNAGQNSGQPHVINLRGATVVPGLIESHTHFVSLANRPGYHVAQWELAENHAELMELLRARRAAVPAGQFITAMGSGTPRNFAENRLPTLAEIDAAVSDRPVFLYQGGTGPVRVNTLGKQFFEGLTNPPVTVAADGLISGASASAALYHLRIRQTFEDKKRSALDAMAYSAQVGVTTVLDQVLVAGANGTLDPLSLEPQPNQFLFQLNHYRMYDAWAALHAEGKAFLRLQMNFLHNQGFNAAYGEGLDKQLPELRERLKNVLPFFGDDMMRTGAIGEWAAPFGLPGSANHAVWVEAQRLVAKARWRNENAQSAVANIQQVVETYEAVDREFGIKDLRWGLQHADLATDDQLQRLKQLHCAVSLSGFRYTGNPRADGQPVGPLFANVLRSGIQAGIHMDGLHIAPHNPWFALHYATTGLNLQGVQINPGQQVSRYDAMYLYTRGNAWYLNREQELGSIEDGKLGDLVVLDRDYFAASDAAMRKTRPALTVIDGRVVHDTGLFGSGHREATA